jgi:sigma-B regulation protein RsbU (phosphoserine phosphatase)
MNDPIKILLLEDSPSDVDLVKRTLLKNDLVFSMEVVSTRLGFEEKLFGFDPDIVLSDHSLPQFSSLEALEIARNKKKNIPFILITGSVSEEFAVDCMKAGVDDYILKNSLIRLPSSIHNILSKNKVKREKDIVESLHRELLVAYKKIEDSTKSITDSINYAKLIQHAMFVDKGILRNYLNDHFIIFRPKDIVSGDFYWFAQVDQKLVVAIVDCTGHGVPGAFMSMIGYGILNEIVNLQRTTQPAEILKSMNESLNRALKKSIDQQSYDGMDLAICTIDKENSQLEFAGANRHLYYYTEQHMEQIKGNKFGIGGAHINSHKEFTNHKITFNKGDRAYLFTDGFADQFGGEKEKRMMTKNLAKLIGQTTGYGIIDQCHKLTEYLDKWQGKIEQTDDILLLGMEF